MKLVNPSWEILEQKPGLEGIYEQIELAGRTCYKSQRKEGTTAKDFVDRMIKSGHNSMLEHGTVYLHIADEIGIDTLATLIDYTYGKNPYSKVNEEIIDGAYHYFITTNYRHIVENGLLDDLQYLCEPTEFHEKRITVRFTTDRGVSHEFVRHRVFSFAQESTRYCNYSKKDKFGSELTFIIPSWIDTTDIENVPLYLHGKEYMISFGAMHFINALSQCESCYLSLIRDGATPQQARQVLPNALKTELVMTGFISDWQNFFQLRTSIIAETGKPHPDASFLADSLYREFKNRHFI